MHGDLAAQLLQRCLVARALQRDQHADAAKVGGDGVVHIGGDGAFSHLETGRAAQHHVLADGGDQIGDRVGHGLAIGGLGRRDGLDRAVGVQGDLGCLARGELEQLVAGDEVGFGVELDRSASHAGAVGAQGDGHQALGRYAVSLFGRLGQALGAQPVHGGFDFAAVLLQGLLAVHHACAGLFAQFLHQAGRDLRHGGSPVSNRIGRLSV